MARKKRPCRRRNHSKPTKCSAKPKKLQFKEVEKPKPATVTKIRIPVRQYEYCHDKFLSFAQIKEYLQKMVKKYPKRIELECVGQSREGRPIYLAKISERTSEEPKMATMIEAGTDGSDWMAISSALFLIDFLTKNSSLRKLMDYLILPCLNPDAYDYSISNCKPSNTKTTMNLSNNLPVTLGLADIKAQRTEDVLLRVKSWKENYVFRSPETLARIRTISAHQVSVRLFVSLKEGGENIVYPFGFCEDSIADHEELRAVAKAGQSAFKCRCLAVGSIFDLCGLTYGTVIDFLRTNQQAIKFTYILHLREKKTKPDPKNIINCGNDVVNCVKSMARNVFMHYSRTNKCA